MKVKTNKTEGFQPFDITFTIESEAEARAMYAIFNHADNLDLLGLNGDEADEVKEQIGDQYYVRSGEMTNGITYEDYYMKGL